jgi:uncharacterized protein DUF6152
MSLPAGNRFLPIEGAFTTVKHNKSLVICALTICLLIYGLPALAHHGNAAYDLDNPITLKGTVTEFAWSNPHVQIYFDVKNSAGAVTHWASETVSPGMLSRRGWSKTELKAGDGITITLGPAKSGAPVGFTLKVVLADGTVLQLGQGRDLPNAP